MASQSQICNLALSHLGVGKEIANLETERSPEAAACRRFYDIALETTLRDFPWPFATKIAALPLVDENIHDEWGYSYRYPTDAIHLRRVLSGMRSDTASSRVPYRLSQDDAGVLIYTDQAQASIEYTLRADNPTIYPPDFVLALSFRLATLIAPRITGGDPFKVGDKAQARYEDEINRARASALNEAQIDIQADSEFIRVRE